MIMNRFQADYDFGKESEIISLPDLQKIFKTDLVNDPETYAHFDFHKDNILVELKTRPNTEWIDGRMKHTTEKGKVIYIDTLYFDAPKMRFAFQHNKYRRLNGEKEKDFYIVWKCSNDYFYWKINWDGKQGNRKDYFIEEQNKDFGHGFKQSRDVVNVYISKMKRITFP